jgi:hypothetical protein
MRISSSLIGLGRAASRTRGLKQDYFIMEFQDRFSKDNPESCLWRTTEPIEPIVNVGGIIIGTGKKNDQK